ncbi:MAG: hypothetical protein V1921_06695 [Candidatus Altiarchaeota archaeon]
MTGTKVVKLKLEDEGLGKKLPNLKADPVVDHAVEVYGQREYRDNYMEIIDYHQKVLEDARGWDVTSTQLQEICGRIDDGYSNELKHDTKLGIFLSALMNESNHKEFKLKVRTPLSHLGYLASDKDITVTGDLGEAAGHCMKDGKLIVKGNTRDMAGLGLEGGEIIVEGNAGTNTARLMEGGTLHIKGNSGILTALSMTGGILRVEGKIKEMSDDIRGGEIWQGNKKVWPR